MTRRALACRADDSADTAAWIMLEQERPWLLVTDDDGKVLGILGQGDLHQHGWLITGEGDRAQPLRSPSRPW
jgi:CBS-domain-containing membrane protein